MKATVFTLLALLAGAAHADPAQEACTALRSARIHLVALMGTTNPDAFTRHRQQVDAASMRLDEVLAAMTGNGGEGAARASTFKPVWDAFRTTRETEIIPAVQAGKYEVARDIAMGIQAERMKKMRETMSCE